MEMLMYCPCFDRLCSQRIEEACRIGVQDPPLLAPLLVLDGGPLTLETQWM